MSALNQCAKTMTQVSLPSQVSGFVFRCNDRLNDAFDIIRSLGLYLMCAAEYMPVCRTSTRRDGFSCVVPQSEMVVFFQPFEYNETELFQSALIQNGETPSYLHSVNLFMLELTSHYFLQKSAVRGRTTLTSGISFISSSNVCFTSSISF